jgi:hypothetical protein
VTALCVDLNAKVTLFCRAMPSKSIVHFLMKTEVARAVQRQRAAQRQPELPSMNLDRGRTVLQMPQDPRRGRDMSR